MHYLLRSALRLQKKPRQLSLSVAIADIMKFILFFFFMLAEDKRHDAQ